MAEDRGEDDHDYNAVSFNPNKSLSIEHQRTRLPIFNVSLLTGKLAGTDRYHRWQYKDHFAYLLEKYQVVVVVGETGCGKSTQIPQFLHDLGYCTTDRSIETGEESNRQYVGVTEPRRVAAISLAARVAEEMGFELGAEVGYSIRFEDCYDQQRVRVKFMTEGILIREMMNNPLLSNYSALVVDETHERSVNTDILLSLLKKIIRKRPDLK